MRNAGSRFADSTRRSATAVATVLLTCLSLALGTAPAAAEHVHGPVSYEFGQNGKPTSTFGSIGGIAYDQGNERIYVLGHGSVYGFSNPSPGIVTPLPAPFPLLENLFVYSEEDLAVDNSGGSTAGHLYFPYGYNVNGWNTSGEPVPGFIGEELNAGTGMSDIAVDSKGQLFLGLCCGSETIGLWGPGGGGQSASISTRDSVGEVGSLALDPVTDDLWVTSYYYSKLARYSESSGYTSFTEFPMDLGGRTSLAINGARHVIYVSTGEISPSNQINAYSTITGELLDSFEVPGTISDLTVKESTDTLFVSMRAGRVDEFRPVLVPKPTTGEPIADDTVSGTADPDGAGEITECFFEFGPSTSYGSTQACDQSLPLTTLTQVTTTLPGLTAETPTHYRLVLGNTSARVRGGDQTITPHYVKGLRTDQASGIGRTAATLEAHFEGTNMETHYHFEWGMAGSSYEHSTPDETKPPLTGNVPLSLGISGLTADTTYHYRIIASNELGPSTGQDVAFTTSPAVKGLATGSPSNVTTDTATLRGTLDPDGIATTYYFQYGQSTAYGQTAPAPPGQPVGSTTPGPTQIAADVSGLQPGTTYHYRIVAVNGFGTTTATDDQTVSTAQAPSVNSFTSRNVSADSAELLAQINPNEATTEYRFEYGTTLAYGTSVPVPDGMIAASPEAQAVSVQLSGLEATTYHFRVVAESKWGTTTTGDQTFNFFPPPCPNAHLREQTSSSYLPDCRAYEMVSPVSAGNVALLAQGPVSPGATSPARFTFSGVLSGIEGSGETQVDITDLYVATRTPSGWVTKYVGIPATVASDSSGPPNESEDLGNIRASRDLSRFLVWEPGNFFGAHGPRAGTYAPFVRTAEGTGAGRLPTNLAEFPGAGNDANEGGFIGDVEISKDFSHFIFSSRNIAFAEGGLTSAPGSVYSDDIETGAVTLISRTPQGDPIPQDAGGSEEYIEIPGVSTDGSHVLMSTKGPGGNTHLYMSVDASSYYDVSKGQDGENHAVKYVGMTEDGSEVYFTSAEQLTADDHDESTDLFEWSEAEPATVTRVSTGSNGTGDTDTCPKVWTTGCNVAPLSTGVRSDNAIASGSGDIYFYSPELLDGPRGTLGDRNLYVFARGHVHFVATLPGSDIVTRIQVSPNDDHMALITRAKLTSSLTGGHLEMYSFDPRTGEFVCVSCKTNGEVPSYDVEGSQNGLFMSDDGRTFFSTIDALVSQDTDGLRDSYEYVDNRAQLLSSGTADRTEGTGFVGVGSDGVDAYFSTLETLVPQDTVGPFLKFYDARSGGGIPFQRVAAPCAAADECHGPEAGSPSKLPSTTGASLGAGGNLHSGKKSRHKKRGKKKKHRSKRPAKYRAKPHPQRAKEQGAQRG